MEGENMKENKKTIQILAIVTLLIAIACISVGFAFLSQDLKISGQAKVVPASWDVHFDDSTMQFNANSTDATNHEDGDTSPYYSFNADKTELESFKVVLTKPGDKGTYTFDVVNEGDIDAVVSTVSTLANCVTVSGTDATTGDADAALVRSNLTYTISYENGDPIGSTTAKDTLTKKNGSHDTETIKIEFELPTNMETMPENPVEIDVSNFTITYVQANN